MSLSNDIISQFVKITNDTQKVTKKETITYGKVLSVDDNHKAMVILDGTTDDLKNVENAGVPVSTTVKVSEGDRVIVMIKNHSGVITGNLGNPAASNKDVVNVSGQITTVTETANNAKDTADKVAQQIIDVNTVLAEKVDTKEFTAEIAKIENLQTDSLLTKTVKANEAEVKKLNAKDVEITGRLYVNEGNIKSLQTDKLDAESADLKYATIESLNTTNLEVESVKGAHAEFESAIAEEFSTVNATIENLQANKLSAEQAAITYANIDFTNITKAAMEYLYAASGLIENVVVGDGTITGVLVGVTIKGDTIEGNTIVADKLVIQGEDGLYYKLNTDGITTEAEQTEYNSLDGKVIAAKSITATKISVDDLVAFDATIGGFNITENSISSEVKDSEGNTTRGIYMDTDGQFNFGDETNFVKYYRAEDGSYKLVISAASILYALNGKHCSLEDLGMIGEYVNVGVYQDEPCIELGEKDSDFKLIITNTRILFMEGTSVPAYINNQSLHITKAVIEEEIQQGEFIWKVRANGNMGLMWKGDE